MVTEDLRGGIGRFYVVRAGRLFLPNPVRKGGKEGRMERPGRVERIRRRRSEGESEGRW
jgi:hypothetical protein